VGKRMSDVTYTCTYCGNKWEKEATYHSWMSARDMEDPKCPKCGDKNIKADKHSTEMKDAFGYNIE
jgi:NAD-dependent SIR2 family protein deacetylase